MQNQSASDAVQQNGIPAPAPPTPPPESATLAEPLAHSSKKPLLSLCVVDALTGDIEVARLYLNPYELPAEIHCCDAGSAGAHEGV
jgi:hypothetical protein